MKTDIESYTQILRENFMDILVAARYQTAEAMVSIRLDLETDQTLIGLFRMI